MGKRSSTYLEMLETLCNKASDNRSFSNVDKKLGMLSNYVMAVEVLDRFKTLRDNISNGVIDMDYCKFDIQWEHWNVWAIRKVNKFSESKEWNEDNVKSMVNRIQDDLPENLRVEFNSERRDRLATSISMQLSNDYSFEMLQEAFVSVIGKIINITIELNSLGRQRIKDSEYEALVDRYLKNFNPGELRVTMMKKEYDDDVEKYVNLKVEDIKEKRASFMYRLLRCEFLGTHYMKEVHISNDEKIMYLDEITSDDGHLYFSKDMVKAYIYMRQFINYESGLYEIGDKIMLGKHIYKNRDNLTDGEIYKFFQYMFIIDYVQKDLKELMEEEKEKRVEEYQKKMDDQAVDEPKENKGLKEQLLNYVSVLEKYYAGTPAKHSSLWGKIIKMGNEIQYTTKGGKKLMFLEKDRDSKFLFSRTVVHSIIGIMIRNGKYKLTPPEAAKILGEKEGSRTIAHAINKPLIETVIDEGIVEKVTSLI